MIDSKREIKSPPGRPDKKHHPLKIWVLSLLPIFLVLLPAIDLYYGSGQLVMASPFAAMIVAVIVLALSYGVVGTRRGILILAIMVICWFLAYVVIANFHGGFSHEAQIKSNLHAIHIALERYAVDTGGRYPEDVNSLINENYLAQFPTNRYDTGDFIQMVPIAFSEEPFEGNFTYVPVFDGENVIGFYLFNYGLEDEQGRDVNGDGIDDHVILVITNGIIGDVAWPLLEELLD